MRGRNLVPSGGSGKMTPRRRLFFFCYFIATRKHASLWCHPRGPLLPCLSYIRPVIICGKHLGQTSVAARGKVMSFYCNCVLQLLASPLNWHPITHTASHAPPPGPGSFLGGD